MNSNEIPKIYIGAQPPDKLTIEDKKEEKKDFPELPVSELKAEWDRIWKDIRTIENDIEHQAYLYKQKLLANDENLKTLKRQLVQVRADETADEQKILRDFYEKTQRGEYGKGELVMIRDIDGSKLARVLPVINRTNIHNPSSTEPIPRDLTVHASDVLNNERFSSRFQFVELPLEGTTKIEYDNIFSVLRDSLPPNALMNLFPEDYKPQVKPGDIFEYGSVSHSSGEISGIGMVLPTGRLAIFSEYEGDRGHKNEFWGVLSNPRTELDWSARSGGLQNPEVLDDLTEEEIQFLKGQDMPVKVLEDHLIG